MSDDDDRPPVPELLEASRFRGGSVTWDDIIGHAPAKRELAMVAAQHRRAGVAERLGLQLIRGLIIYGPPGTGKTMLAAALATSIDERPVYVLPSAEADPRMVREVYEHLADTPCVIVWDEADVILQKRRTIGADSKLVAAFCTALDGLGSRSGPITIALTAEEVWQLDASAIRSGRLSTKIEVELPRRSERREILERRLARVPQAGDIDLDAAADRTSGCSGADIEAIVMAALGLSMVEGIDAIDQAHLTEALLRRGHVEERDKPTRREMHHRAIHEAGHALLAAHVFGPEAVVSVTIRTGHEYDGRTSLADRFRRDGQLTYADQRNLVHVAWAGYCAEQIVFGADHSSIGAESDISRATRSARRLICDLAASNEVGPVDVGVIESGSMSDHGSEVMRSRVYAAIAHESRGARDHAMAMLRPKVEHIALFADLLLVSEDQTLSGPALTEVLSQMVGTRQSSPIDDQDDA